MGDFRLGSPAVAAGVVPIGAGEALQKVAPPDGVFPGGRHDAALRRRSAQDGEEETAGPARGRRMMKRVPFPGWLATSMLPSWLTMAFWASGRPSPVPSG